MELSTKQVNEENEKVRALSAEIIVSGTMEKPYYEIKYFDLSDMEYHIGYSSYDLKNVFRWREECFEVVKENECDMVSEQVKELRECGDRILFPPKIRNIFNEAADTIETLSAKLQAANMERSVDCGGWISCKERLPEENQNVIACFAHGTVTELRFYDKKFHGIYDYDEKVIIAWQPLPEPYHEP